DRSPAWSPDGEYLAFASNRAENWDLYLLDLKSDVLIRLTHHPHYDGNPSWSPDGKRLAFESYRSGNLDVYVMTAGGDDVRPITSDPAADFAPAWGPDARSLAFTSLRDGNKDIHVYLEDQDRVTNITRSPGIEEDQPSWSADGSRIAYVTGPQDQTSVQVRAFDWETLSANRGETEFFGTGTAPAWAPDGASLLYARARGDQSHLVAASMTGWALFHEVCSIQGFVDSVAWTDARITPHLWTRALEADARSAGEHSGTLSYTETVRPTPTEGAPHSLIDLPGVSVTEGAPKLSDAVDDSFNALRARVYEETGWDYLAHLNSAWLPLTYDPPSGHSRKSWSLCGRAFRLDQEPYNADEGSIALVREDIGDTTYWRVFLRAAHQDGTLGEPMRALSWDLLARERGGRPAVDGGVHSDQVLAGYYVDFTALAREYGWERTPSMWRWRHFWPDILWWEYRKTDSLSWWECMVSVLEPSQVESTFGPIPRREN
ncbi:MAG: TolB family protein, partial [Chloroflexota bacterium]